LRQLTNGGGNYSSHTTPDGKWVLYTATRDGKTFVYRIAIEGGEPVRVIDNESGNPRVSPDGRLIACHYKSNGKSSRVQLAVVKIEGGAPLKLFDVAHSARLSDGIRWTPDARAVCYRDATNGIWRQDIDGGPPQKLPGLPEETSFAYGWSRNGRSFAFTRGRTLSDAVLISYIK